MHWREIRNRLGPCAFVAVLLTASGVAETILTIFEPKQVAAVPITAGDITTAMNGLSSYGTLTWSTPPKPYEVPDLATAAGESGLIVLAPAQLPAGARRNRQGQAARPRFRRNRRRRVL